MCFQIFDKDCTMWTYSPYTYLRSRTRCLLTHVSVLAYIYSVHVHIHNALTYAQDVPLADLGLETWLGARCGGCRCLAYQYNWCPPSWWWWRQRWRWWLWKMDTWTASFHSALEERQFLSSKSGHMITSFHLNLKERKLPDTLKSRQPRSEQKHFKCSCCRK